MRNATPGGDDPKISTENASMNNGPWPVRPLTRTRRDGTPYTREAEVEAEVDELSSLNGRVRKSRLLAPPGVWGSRERVREETLVYFVRQYAGCGDEETAWAIADALAERTEAHIARKLGRWRLTPEDAEDCTRDLITVMYESLFAQEASEEFWEVRFWVCLDRRLYNLLEKRQMASDTEVSNADTGESTDGEPAEERLTRMADVAPTPDVLAEHKEALALLTENERLALHLCYIEGLPEESEDPEKPSAAKILKVTGRSVRNYLRRAKDKLRTWEQSAQNA